MAKHLLTDRTIKAAKPKASPYRIADGGNLYLFVSSTGVKSWQYRYRLDGRPLTATLGKYPAVTLEEARRLADRARGSAEAGEHLTQIKRAAKLATIARGAAIFEQVAADWLEDEALRKKWTPEYKLEVKASLRNHLSALNRFAISSINAPLIVPIRRKVERRAPLMFDKVERRLHSIMDFAVEQGLIPSNPLPRRRSRITRRHFPAVTDLEGVGEILRAARAADPCKGIMRAHLLLAFTALRVSEITCARWSEFALDGVEIVTDHKKHRDPDAGNWSVPRARMKRKDPERGPHVVALPPVLLGLLREWRQADGEGALYVCPAPRDANFPITPEGVEKFYRRVLELAGKHSPHSWRSAFSTICREAGKSGEVVEAQLDHVVGTKTESAYDRAARLELRRELMRWYEKKLIAARDGAQVVPMRARK